MTTTLILIVFLILFAIVLTVVGLGLRFLETERKRRVQSVLNQAAGIVAHDEVSILEDADYKPGALEELLGKIPITGHIQTHLRLGGQTTSPATILMVMAALGVLGAWLGARVTTPMIREFSMTGLALALGSLPYAYVRVKSRQRMDKFDEMFPEALDFLARSLRAGHAFSVSLEMMADESPDPIGVEFRRVFHEQNLGAPLDVALRNFALRLPLLEVRLFVSAVLLQRETGGNLAEILSKLAYIIRERFRLRGQVRAASAHGRITAIILSAMPILTMLGLQVVAPTYLATLTKDEDGRLMILLAITGQLLGYYWMRRIINIKV